MISGLAAAAVAARLQVAYLARVKLCQNGQQQGIVQEHTVLYGTHSAAHTAQWLVWTLQIKLQSSDLQIFEVEEEVANESVTVKNMIEGGVVLLVLYSLGCVAYLTNDMLQIPALRTSSRCPTSPARFWRRSLSIASIT